MKLRKVDSKSVVLHEGSNVTLKTCGDSQEVQFTAGNNTKCPIQNLSKNKYLDKVTGEIKERVHPKSRYQSPKSARKSTKRLMDLIRCNATVASHCKWITVTYGEVMTGHKRVYEDGKMFLRRLQ